jgi:ribonuclease R
MPKKKGKSTNKAKKSLKYIVQKVFETNPDSILTHKQVCALIDVKENALRKLVFELLEDLVFIGSLERDGHLSFRLAGSASWIEGRIELTNRGSGYVVTDDDENDIYIAPANTERALNGDRVKVSVFRRGKTRLEGRVVEIVSRETEQFVGTIEMHPNFGFLIPDSQKMGTDIYVPKEHLKGAKNGDKCLVKITVWPKSSKNPYGEVIEVLGKPGSHDVEMISILCNQGISYVFPEQVLSESEELETHIPAKEISRRKDLRNVLTFTIDPIDARDFDDALSIQPLENGNTEIGVHIADVSFYVQENNDLDKEAQKRANSVYLVDRVVPMLPEKLSNIVCSLRPNEDKLCFSVLFEINQKGEVINHSFTETIIHSDHRYTYEEVQEIIEGKDDKHRENVLYLDKIAKILRKKRLKEGALNFSSEELRFVLNQKGEPVEVIQKTSKDAHKLIEEFMLLANKYVALFMGKGKEKNLFVYRIHDKPDQGKMEQFNVFIQQFGQHVETADPKKIGQSINKLLENVENQSYFSIIQSMAIRSMAKAEYNTQNIGHYGLGFPFYTHFTSPIRRYADLIVHRLLKEKLSKITNNQGNHLSEVCKHLSRMERKAVEAERESNKYFQTVFVSDKKGEIFDGKISGLTEYGIFVRMAGNYCEGMVPLHTIKGERFYFDNEKYTVIGSRSGKTFAFGDDIRVKIMETHLRKRQIDLALVEL